MTDASSTPDPPAASLPWRYRVEGWIAAAGIRIVGLLPLDWASAIGGTLARTIGPRLGASKRARINLRAAMPELSEREIETIVRGMWDNLGRVVFEYPHLSRITIYPAELNDGRVEVLGVEHIEKARAEGRSFILVAGHLANWEIAPLASAQYGLDVAFIYRAANNPTVDAMIGELRQHAKFFPKGAIASRQAFATLRRGAHLGLLADQKMNDGIAVPFFGRDAMTAPALALLALRFGCDVLPARVERLGGAHFRLTVHPALPLSETGDRDADVLTLMTEVNRTLEGWIRERPEQWFWLHRRWPD
ncbi:MAG TPA: lauroyl acyltransferase [Stellaceae bacterium]|nr:lauroyl acyltransferase [Stellaceae bacterium]